MRADQVTQVRGYADQMLRVKDNPIDPSNRRISILVKNKNEAGQPSTVPASKVLDGSIPVVPQKPGAAPAAAPAAGNAAAPAPVAASKPTAAKPSLMDKLKGMMPGVKKK